jgi:hypothetical protein
MMLDTPYGMLYIRTTEPIAPITQIPASKGVATMKADFRLDGGDFCSTTCTVEPLSEKGKTLFAEMFGQGVVSATLRKSGGLDFARFAEQRGLVVAG